MFFIIHILFGGLCLIEAKLESIVIALKNPNVINYTKLNRQEHRWSAIYYLAVVALTTAMAALMIGLTWKCAPIAISLLINRRIFFEYFLKRFRSRPIRAIEGDQPLDKALRKLLGANGGYKELLLLIIALVAIYFVTFKIF